MHKFEVIVDFPESIPFIVVLDQTYSCSFEVKLIIFNVVLLHIMDYWQLHGMMLPPLVQVYCFYVVSMQGDSMRYLFLCVGYCLFSNAKEAPSWLQPLALVPPCVCSCLSLLDGLLQFGFALYDDIKGIQFNSKSLTSSLPNILLLLWLFSLSPQPSKASVTLVVQQILVHTKLVPYWFLGCFWTS